MTVLTAALLGVAVGAGTIAGCASEEEPAPQSQQEQDKPESAPEPEPTKEETPAGPELPDKLDGEHTRAVLAYYEEYNRAARSGDTQKLRTLATKDCWSCNSSADVIDKTYESGGRMEGQIEPIIDDPDNLAMRRTDTNASVTIRYRQDTLEVYANADAEPAKTDPVVDKHVNLVKEGNQWMIDEITSQPVEK